MTNQPNENAAGNLCSALFDTPDGTGVCESFGPHDRHGGVVTVGHFMCHHCRRDVKACRCSIREVSA